MQERWLSYRSCFSEPPICVIHVLGQLGYLLKRTVKAQDVGWCSNGCRIALLQQHRLKLWKEGSWPSTGLMPKKASAQHIISPMCTLDFKIPVAKLLKNHLLLFPRAFINQSLLCAPWSRGPVSSVSHFWLFILVEPLWRLGVSL